MSFFIDILTRRSVERIEECASLVRISFHGLFGSDSGAVITGKDKQNARGEAEQNKVAPSILSEVADTAFKVMTVRLDAKGCRTLPKAERATEWSPIYEDSNALQVMLLPRFGYRIRPASPWESMKKLKRFVKRGVQFQIDDYVCINNHAFEEAGRHNDQQEWVAQLLEIRKHDTGSTYLRVLYLYWPEDLPSGRLPYHGNRELIISNHMDIIDADCINDRVEVAQLPEQRRVHEQLPADDGLYWRQAYDVSDGKLSSIVGKGRY